MWLGKLFGARKRTPEIDLNEEPARFVAPDPQQDFKRRTQQDALQAKPEPNGFDPYNSGAFKKKDDGWERVGRR